MIKGRGRTRICTECQHRKPRKAFVKHRSLCKACNSRQLKDIRETHKRIIKKHKSVPCADCKKKYPTVCMDFDHIRGHKEGLVSHLARNMNTAKLLEEIAKCEVVCANCHRIRTETRRLAILRKKK